MPNNDLKHQQDENTEKLVMNTFYKVAPHRDGVAAEDIAEYLRRRYGDLWRLSTLTGKAEQTLQRSAKLGFLDRRGDRYVSNLAREGRCCPRRRPRRCCRRRRSCCRRRRSCCPKRKRRCYCRKV